MKREEKVKVRTGSEELKVTHSFDPNIGFVTAVDMHQHYSALYRVQTDTHSHSDGIYRAKEVQTTLFKKYH